LYNQANKIISCSAPFYDGNWWSVLLEQGASAPYQKLKVANSIYNGNDGFKIGYIATSSYSGGAGLWGGGYSSFSMFLLKTLTLLVGVLKIIMDSQDHFKKLDIM
jgi:hypothetical protein